MSVMMRFRLGDALLLLGILVAAAGLRAGYLVLACDAGRQPSPLHVQGEQSEEQAQLVASLRENWFFGGRPPFARPDVREQTAHLAPGYPWLLSLAARLPGDLPLTIRWAQCGLGALTAGLYFLFARRAFRSRVVGTLAGLFAALYPFWIINCAEINDDVLASFLLAVCLALGAHVGQQGGSLLSLIFGVMLAAACLVRPAWLPFGFATLLWFLLRCRDLSKGWFLSLLAVLGFTNGLAPWTVRNYQVTGDIIPLVDTTYVELWMGNNPRATGGPQDEEVMLQALAQQRGQDVETVRQELAAATPRERGRLLAAAVVTEVQRNPAATLQRRLGAGVGFFLGGAWPAVAAERSAGSLPEWLTAYPAVLLGALLAVLLLGVLGWRWTYGWRDESMPAALAVLWIPLPYLLSHAGALHGPRLPLDGVLLCYAAFALCCLVPGYGRNFFAGSASLPQVKEPRR